MKLTLALLWERRDRCQGAVPLLVCHDEVVVECYAEQAEDAKSWLEKTMIEGMEVVPNAADDVDASVELEARKTGSWGEEG
jgi:hypothetical protein